jgi:hypothetical protein
VYCPFLSGCGSIAQYLYLEKEVDCPRAVLEMFDISACPLVPENVLSFSVPMNNFMTMIDDIEESFQMTSDWSKVQKRIKL